MATVQMNDATPEVADVLVQMYQLLYQARAEAYQRFRATPKDLSLAELTGELYEVYALIFDMIPAPHLEALLDRPQITGADPIDLARQAELLSRTQPVHHFPPGIAAVVVRLIDTVRSHS